MLLKRSIGAVLWSVSTWWAYALIAHFLGLPTNGGVVLGALVAAFVLMDPTGAFRGSRTRDVAEADHPTALGLTAPTR